jgi:hypothetical protein
MMTTLMNDLAETKQIDLVQPSSQLFKLHCLKTKIKNCLTPDLTHDIDASMAGRATMAKYMTNAFDGKP